MKHTNLKIGKRGNSKQGSLFCDVDALYGKNEHYSFMRVYGDEAFSEANEIIARINKYDQLRARVAALEAALKDLLSESTAYVPGSKKDIAIENAKSILQ